MEMRKTFATRKITQPTQSYNSCLKVEAQKLNKNTEQKMVHNLYLKIDLTRVMDPA